MVIIKTGEDVFTFFRPLSEATIDEKNDRNYKDKLHE
jgi:hypothetical protein